MMCNGRTQRTMTRGFTAAVVMAGIGAILFSAKAIVVKLCYLWGADAGTVLALRMIFSLPFFWGAVWWVQRREPLPPIARKDKLTVLFLGFVGYYLSSYLDFLGLQFITAGLERIILYLNPALVLLLSAWILKRTINARQWLSMGIAYLGVLLVFIQDVRIDGPQVALGGALVFGAAFTYAIYLIFAGEIVKRVGSLRLVAYASGSSTVFCLLQALIMAPEALVTQPAQVYGLSLINASLCTFVPMLLIMMAIQRVGSGIAAQAGAIGPIATVFLGWFFLNEAITPIQLIGMAIVLISMAVLLTAQPGSKMAPSALKDDR